MVDGVWEEEWIMADDLNAKGKVRWAESTSWGGQRVVQLYYIVVLSTINVNTFSELLVFLLFWGGLAVDYVSSGSCIRSFCFFQR